MSEIVPQSPQNKRQITIEATKSYKGAKARKLQKQTILFLK